MAQVLGVLIRLISSGLWIWLQSTATALSCIFDRPAGEPHVPACLVASGKQSRWRPAPSCSATCLNTCAAAESGRRWSTPRESLFIHQPEATTRCAGKSLFPHRRDRLFLSSGGQQRATSKSTGQTRFGIESFWCVVKASAASEGRTQQDGRMWWPGD